VHGVNGAPEEIVDGRGQELGASTRSAYGRVTWSSSSKATTPFRFPGQIEDPETGLHYNRYRTYDPETGRYLTHDPIELEGGMNLYAYGPNPIAWIDPMGWQHHMDVSGPDAFGSFARLATGGDVNAGYDSGYHGLGTEANPHELRSQARCHTEQRFAHDLIHSGRRWDGEEFELTGSLPPCPNCHRALQHAADRTGANITYNWTDPVHGPQSISYSPNAAPVGDGNLAEPLTAAYGMTADSSRRNGYRFESWSGASAAYTAASAGDVAFFDD
jgi:RHS repeat-associated protein